VAHPREAVGCRTLICRGADSGQLDDLATNQDCVTLQQSLATPGTLCET